MNERHDDLQEIIDAALREMAAEEGDGFDPQTCNLAEFCRREDAPRAGLRARVLHAGAQDLLHKGDRAQGQVPEGRPAGKHLAGRLLARQAVVPHR